MGKSGKHRVPTASIIPKAGKSPKSLGPLADDGCPRFVFRDMDCDTKWGEGDHSKATFDYIADKLKQHERVTWNDLNRKDHAVEVGKLCSRAQSRLRDLNLDDQDTLYRIGFTGLERLWGVKDGSWFRVLWWDPRHEVFPYVLKHT